MGAVWTITLGEAIASVSIILSAAAIFFGIKSDVRVVKHDLHGINEKIAILTTSFSQIGDVLTKVAVQDNRLDRAEQDIRELKHGDGMVLPLRKSPYEAGA